jgi:hypothetical protein
MEIGANRAASHSQERAPTIPMMALHKRMRQLRWRLRCVCNSSPDRSRESPLNLLKARNFRSANFEQLIFQPRANEFVGDLARVTQYPQHPKGRFCETGPGPPCPLSRMRDDSPAFRFRLPGGLLKNLGSYQFADASIVIAQDILQYILIIAADAGGLSRSSRGSTG